MPEHHSQNPGKPDPLEEMMLVIDRTPASSLERMLESLGYRSLKLAKVIGRHKRQMYFMAEDRGKLKPYKLIFTEEGQYSFLDLSSDSLANLKLGGLTDVDVSPGFREYLASLNEFADRPEKSRSVLRTRSYVVSLLGKIFRFKEPAGDTKDNPPSDTKNPYAPPRE